MGGSNRTPSSEARELMQILLWTVGGELLENGVYESRGIRRRKGCYRGILSIGYFLVSPEKKRRRPTLEASPEVSGRAQGLSVGSMMRQKN